LYDAEGAGFQVVIDLPTALNMLAGSDGDGGAFAELGEAIDLFGLGALFDVPVIPHGHSLHAALHLIASQSPAVCPLAEYLILKMRSYYHFEKSALAPVKAHFALPAGPGYGIEFDESKVESQSLLTWP